MINHNRGYNQLECVVYYLGLTRWGNTPKYVPE